VAGWKIIDYADFMSDRSTFDQSDLLSELLDKLKFRGNPGIHGTFSAPWALAFNANPDQAPFYVVAAGTCQLNVLGVGDWELQKGDLVLLPRGDAHILRDDPASRIVQASSLLSASRDQGIQRLQWGGGGKETQVVGGLFRFDSPFSFPILVSMDQVILLRADDPIRLEAVNPLLGLFCREGRSQEPGSRAATSGLLKLLFIEILRYAVLNRDRENRPCNRNPLVLLFDPVLRKAAEAIHFETGRPWNVETLASLSGLSRTSFAVRFQELTGTSPLAYLTQVRMLDAVDLLEKTNDTLGAIAHKVGYGSEAAFSKAFKRELGVSPGTYRKQKSTAGATVVSSFF